MSTAFPNLTKHQLFQSHLVNCNICSKYESAGIEEVEDGIWKTTTKAKTRRFMCPVGVKLFNEALKEDPNKSPFRPKHFPYVAKIYEKVRFRPRGSTSWIEGKVIDRSLASDGRVIGYEVEVVTKSRFKGVLDKVEQFYVNTTNIKPLVTWKEKQEALKSKEQPHIFEDGGSPDPGAWDDAEEALDKFDSEPEPKKFKFHIGGE